ncbi:MAG: DUF805 domain-containing protein [Alphaproteobacteria bacterium]
MPNIEKTSRQMREKAREIFSTAPSFSISQAFMYFIEAWKKYFVFSGRSDRMMFWSFVFFNLIIGSLIGLVVGIQGSGVYSFISFFPAWAVAVRRLHDIGQTGLWTLIPVALTFSAGFSLQMQMDSLATLCSSLSLIFSVLLLFFLCLKSDGENKYGPAPSAG